LNRHEYENGPKAGDSKSGYRVANRVQSRHRTFLNLLPDPCLSGSSRISIHQTGTTRGDEADIA